MSHPLLLITIGLFSGAMMMTSLLMQAAAQGPIPGSVSYLALLGLGMAGVFAALLFKLRQRIHALLDRSRLSVETCERFKRRDIRGYFVFLAFGLAVAGVHINLAFLLLLLVLFAIGQAVLLWTSADSKQKEQWRAAGANAVPLLFFISGFAALIDQVVWQRVLFATFGINIESVTVVVAVFMSGLGIGALAGGWIQRKLPGKRLECFIAIELAIGAFGLVSIPLIHAVGEMAPPDSLPALVGVIYALLAFPTLMMGATLPLLVAYLEERSNQPLGKTVGTLYAFNTFGSALAALLTVYLLFVVTGQQGALTVAAGCNALTAFLAFKLRRHMRLRAPAVQKQARAQISFTTALLLSGAIGYISLSLEILWYRILGFMTAGKPQMFGLLLAVFLCGIAWSALSARKWSETGRDLREFVFRSLAYLLLVSCLALPMVSALSGVTGNVIAIPAALLAIYAIAYFSGGIFPALCDMGIRRRGDAETGTAVAWVYFANIVGATLGSLLTGFVLLEYFSLVQNMMLISTLILLPVSAWLIAVRWPAHPALSRCLAAGAAVAALLATSPALHKHVLEHLQGMGGTLEFKYVNEDRSGIITVFDDPQGDLIFGHGAYDGRFNLDPLNNSNGITRVYMLASLHRNPERVLEIGLSGASSTRVLTMYPRIKELISIDINRGYQDVIANYPEIAAAFKQPQMRLVVDDGRRWLNRNPDEKFDVIIMNTMYYWRSNATNVLSREFLELCKRHLKPGGVVYYNTTGGPDNTYTAAHVFDHIVTYMNFVAGSDTPFNLTYEERRDNLLSFTNSRGKRVFAEPGAREVGEELARLPLPDRREELLADDQWWLITDDNMASEYKRHLHFLTPALYYSLHAKP